MTVQMQTTIKRWNGFSTDEKPSTDVPEGSTFHVVDTGEQFIYHNGMWMEDLREIYIAEHV